MRVDELNGMMLGGKFQLGSKIGNGSFGEIYLAKSLKTSEDLAVKIEVLPSDGEDDDGNKCIHPKIGSSFQRFKSQLKREAKIYHKLEGEGGIPKIRWLGLGEHSNYMVMDLLGRSLEDLFNYCDRKFSLKTVLMLSYELISRIETIHNRGKLVHRDIKPENFLMGRGRDRHTVYVIDFGLAKLYQSPKTGRHIPLKEGYSLTGTARYASINAHHGRELSRRDDLISIGYVLVYFLKGSLPWQGFHGQTSAEKYKMILQKKEDTNLEELCADIPEEFRQYFEMVTSLAFEETPSYNVLKNLFRQLFVANQFTYDSILYDWEIIAYQQNQQRRKGPL